MRGLKLDTRQYPLPSWASHPLRVRGLKRGGIGAVRFVNRSHPLRVRGLKHVRNMAPSMGGQSHPLRVRPDQNKTECPDIRHTAEPAGNSLLKKAGTGAARERYRHNP